MYPVFRPYIWFPRFDRFYPDFALIILELTQILPACYSNFARIFAKIFFGFCYVFAQTLLGFYTDSAQILLYFSFQFPHNFHPLCARSSTRCSVRFFYEFTRFILELCAIFFTVFIRFPPGINSGFYRFSPRFSPISPVLDPVFFSFYPVFQSVFACFRLDFQQVLAGLFAHV